MVYVVVSVIDNYIIATAIMPSIITVVMIIMIMPVYTNGYRGRHGEIRRIISVVIRRVIGYIGR